MPVNKHIGKLWFETQEEIDQYDDLMISNIELKDTDIKSENFTILSLREKRERTPSLAPHVQSQMNDYIKKMGSPLKTKPSLADFWEYPILKYFLTTIGGYLVIREIPIRNFYARAFLMVPFLFHLKRAFNPSVNGIVTNLSLHYDPHFAKQYEIFDVIKDAAHVQKPEGQGISSYDEWRMSQPGFYNIEQGTTVTNLNWLWAPKQNHFWDGTFNMPIMPLSDKLHKDFKHMFQTY